MNFPVLVGSLLLLTGTQVSAHIKQEYVLPLRGCGTFCRVETEQLTYPAVMDDGWVKVKVIQRLFLTYKDKNGDWKSRPCSLSRDRCGPPESVVWLFADCAREKFASSSNPDRSNALEKSVFYTEGKLAGIPRHGTVAQNLFAQWVKLCHGKSLEGMELYRREMQKVVDSF